MLASTYCVLRKCMSTTANQCIYGSRCASFYWSHILLQKTGSPGPSREQYTYFPLAFLPPLFFFVFSLFPIQFLAWRLKGSSSVLLPGRGRSHERMPLLPLLRERISPTFQSEGVDAGKQAQDEDDYEVDENPENIVDQVKVSLVDAVHSCGAPECVKVIIVQAGQGGGVLSIDDQQPNSCPHDCGSG